MKRLVIVLALLMACPAWAQDKPAAKPESPPALTEAQQLQAQVFKLKVEVAQLKATLADRELRIVALESAGDRLRAVFVERDTKPVSDELSAEQKRLSAEFLAQLKAPAGAEWDWQTMAIKAPKGKE
jgi:hypothetical protein